MNIHEHAGWWLGKDYDFIVQFLHIGEYTIMKKQELLGGFLHILNQCTNSFYEIHLFAYKPGAENGNYEFS